MKLKFDSFEALADHVSLYGSFAENSSNLFETLLSTRGKLRIPISQRRGRSRDVLVLRSVGGFPVFDILWDCLFGEPRVYQWMILFELVNGTKYYSKDLQLVFDIMMIINKKISPGGGSFDQTMRQKLNSVRKELGNQTANEIANELRSLSYKIPLKRPNIKVSISIEQERFKQSQELRFIGVGYKDKGSLPAAGSEYDPTEFNSRSPDPIILWKRLLKNFKSSY